jgi:hypothetical protein
MQPYAIGSLLVAWLAGAVPRDAGSPEGGRGCRGDVQHDENRRLESGRQRARNLLQGFDAAGGSTNDDDVVAGHISAPLVDPGPGHGVVDCGQDDPKDRSWPLARPNYS